MYQVNEERLERSIVAGLQAILPPQRLSSEMTVGERLSDTDVCALLEEAVAGAGVPDRPDEDIRPRPATAGDPVPRSGS